LEEEPTQSDALTWLNCGWEFPTQAVGSLQRLLPKCNSPKKTSIDFGFPLLAPASNGKFQEPQLPPENNSPKITLLEFSFPL